MPKAAEGPVRTPLTAVLSGPPDWSRGLSPDRLPECTRVKGI